MTFTADGKNEENEKKKNENEAGHDYVYGASTYSDKSKHKRPGRRIP